MCSSGGRAALCGLPAARPSRLLPSQSAHLQPRIARLHAQRRSRRLRRLHGSAEGRGEHQQCSGVMRTQAPAKLLARCRRLPPALVCEAPPRLLPMLRPAHNQVLLVGRAAPVAQQPVDVAQGSRQLLGHACTSGEAAVAAAWAAVAAAAWAAVADSGWRWRRYRPVVGGSARVAGTCGQSAGEEGVGVPGPRREGAWGRSDG